MSPRRRIEPGQAALLVPRTAPAPGSRRAVLAVALTALIAAGALTVCVLALASQQLRHRTAMRDAAMLTDVRSFMTVFTSLDPFHANDYVQRVLDRATGEFHRQYQEKANRALLQVARSEPTTGTVLDAGVERWNDDGSANVLVATAVSGKSPDGKTRFDVASRWLVTAKKEGAQWKISSLIQVI